MSSVSGRCSNIEFCTIATSNRIVTLADDAPFECPKCGEPLALVTKATKARRNPLLGVLQLGAISALVGVFAWKVTLSGNLKLPAPLIPAAGVVAAPGKLVAAVPRADAVMSGSAISGTLAVRPVMAAMPLPQLGAMPAGARQPAELPATASPAPSPLSAATMQTARSERSQSTAPPTTAAPVQKVALLVQSKPGLTPAMPAPKTSEASMPLPMPTAVVLTSEVPVSPEPVTVSTASDSDAEIAEARLLTARFRMLTRHAEKTGYVFRFAAGAVELDDRDRQSASALKEYITARQISPNRLILAGFADISGKPAVNLAVSQARTATVGKALEGLGLKPGREAAFGSAMPAADNRTVAGRNENRRVEVYISPEG